MWFGDQINAERAVSVHCTFRVWSYFYSRERVESASTEYGTNNKKYFKNMDDDDHGGNKIRVKQLQNLTTKGTRNIYMNPGIFVAM